MTCYTAFDTSIGCCGLAWRGVEIVAAALPAADESGTVQAVTRRHPDAFRIDPDRWVQDVIARIQRLFEGEPVSFADVPLGLGAAAPFERLVYRETLAIPHGETRTYGELARAIGQPGAARAVGRALGRNPVPIIIPCHRILAADGRSGGFSAPGGVSTKMKLLDIERARFGVQPSLFDAPGWAIAERSRA